LRSDMNDRESPPEQAGPEIRIIPVRGIPEVRAGDDLAEHIVGAAGGAGLEDRDVVVIAQKVVSKAEGRLVSDLDRASAARAESRRILRRTGDMVISETHHGFICANAGVDESNVEMGRVALLPLDPDLSARRIRERIRHLAAVDVGVIISDTFGRPWRLGQTNIAIGAAGIDCFVDYRGSLDSYGRELVATRICVADELAGAAEIVMGKARKVCAAIVRGADLSYGRSSAAEIVRPSSEDLFR
jgi:coenzyme F420-0:L-glutamate ligase / coenzyme F420-1:gamma-L-glutamate ligase